MNKYYWLTIIAYLVAGLSMSSAQNEEKLKTEKMKRTASEKVAKQDREKNSGVKAYLHAIKAAITELNGREVLAWGNQVLEPEGYTDDASVFKNLDQNLGKRYSFSGAVSGGSISFKGIKKIALKRTPSSDVEPAVWEMVSENKERKQLLKIDDPERAKLLEAMRLTRSHSLDAAISELNGREALAWGTQMLKTEGYTDDASIFKAVDLDLGHGYTVKGTLSGGHIIYKKTRDKVILKRTPSSEQSPAEWKKATE